MGEPCLLLASKRISTLRWRLLLSVRLLAFLTVFLGLASCSDDDTSAGPSGDSTAPARVTDLAASAKVESGLIVLTWTAPGDDGRTGQADRYDLRRSPLPLTEFNWTSATQVVPRPTPAPGGSKERFEWTPPGDGTWYFGIKTADEVPQWSNLSNVAQVAFASLDETPPARVTDLRVTTVAATSVALAWTAPGDDGSTGTADRYELRFAADAATVEAWDEATPVAGVTAPSEAGVSESFLVAGLDPLSTYVFGLRAVDESGNVGPTSNLVMATTLPAGRVKLTNSTGPLGASGPSWSPDGSRLTFQADWGGEFLHFEIYLIGAGGGTAAPLTREPLGARDGKWSPDGTQVSFLASGELNEIRVTSPTPGSPSTLLVADPNNNIAGHDWSPDGTRIVFYSQIGYPPDPIDFDVFIVPVGGGEVDTVLTGARHRHVDWSPDGQSLVYARAESGFGSGQYGLWILDLETRTPRLLIDTDASEFTPDWSPDGSRIVFASYASGNSDLWMIDPDGSNLRQVTSEPEDEREPAWSPDGSRIAYVVDDGETSDVWILEVN